MYINEIFELTRAVNSDEFDRLIARVRDNLEEEEGEEYADRSLSRKGVTVIYRKSRYKKKVRLVVNTAFLFKEKEYDSGKIVQQLEKRVAKYFGDRRSLEEFVLTEAVLMTDFRMEYPEDVLAYLRLLRRIGKVGDHFSLTREDGGQQIAREKRDASHDKTGNQCCLDPIKQGFAGAFKFSGSVVLCHKGRNGLHIGGSYQHQKDADLLSNTNSSRFPNAHTVDHHLNKKKGKLNQQLLQGNGYTHQQNPLYASRIKPNVFFRKSKGQALFANKVKGKYHADPLSRYGCNGSSGGAHAKNRHQQQISKNIDGTGNGNRKKWCFGIANAAKNGTNHIIRDDENSADPTNPHITAGL